MKSNLWNFFSIHFLWRKYPTIFIAHFRFILNENYIEKHKVEGNCIEKQKEKTLFPVNTEVVLRRKGFSFETRKFFQVKLKQVNQFVERQFWPTKYKLPFPIHHPRILINSKRSKEFHDFCFFTIFFKSQRNSFNDDM